MLVKQKTVASRKCAVSGSWDGRALHILHIVQMDLQCDKERQSPQLCSQKHLAVPGCMSRPRDFKLTLIKWILPP